ncbi:MAG: hypothetical protein ACT4PZ_01560 [Panacagrimonas sp.]
MTDPMNALRGLQVPLDQGLVRLQPCELNSELAVSRAEAKPDTQRMTDAHVADGIVQSQAGSGFDALRRFFRRLQAQLASH